MHLFGFLDDTAQHYPDKTAVICDRARITYKRLHERVSLLTGALHASGVTKGTKTGVLCYNSIEYIEIIFALMKLGAVCVPLNYRLTANEITALIEHSGITALFYDGALQAQVPFGSRDITTYITIGNQQTQGAVSYDSLFTGSKPDVPDIQVVEDDEAFILYTAGTTGSPKGVVLTHGNCIANTQNYTDAYGMVPADIELAPTPLFHTSTLGRIFSYVANAATFILCSKFDPGQCLDIIQNEKVTSITQAPTMYHMLFVAAKNKSRDTGSVRRVVTGASLMSPQAKKQLKELFPQAAFFDLYGLTEAAPGVSILKPADFFSKPESVGMPMRNVEIMILKDQSEPARTGQIGEILCRGPNIMKGYYRNEQATARVLRNGWLHTGDMGTLDDEGFLYIVGRKKDIIISGGTNVYPVEIETALMQHPAVDDATVFGVADETWGEKIVAAVVVKPDRSCTAKTLFDFCRQQLAGFKCPRDFLFVNALPRNAAQKVLKSELQKVYGKHS